LSEPWLAVMNPVAGRGRAARAWPALAAAFESNAVAVELVTTSACGEATRVVADAIARGKRRVLAVGGDGTVHEVLNGLVGAPARMTLAVAPFGTGNDWARGRGIPRDAQGIAAMLAAGRTLAHDVGQIDFQVGARRERRHFINLAGVGYDAYVLENMPQRGPRALAYLAAVIGGLLRYRPALTTIDAGGVRRTGRYFAAFAAIGRYAGGGMQFAPNAKPDDGLVDLVTIDHLGILATLARLPKIYTGRLLADPAVYWQATESLLIATDEPVRVEADGQLLGTTPARIRTLRRAIDVVVPTRNLP
jgi:YegS/Rv2252/BmrU family lipid kinase